MTMYQSKSGFSELSVVIANDHLRVAGGASEVAIREAVLLKSAGVNVHFFGCCGPVDGRLTQLKIPYHATLQPEIKDARGIKRLTNLWNLKASDDFRRSYSPLASRIKILHVHSFTKALSPSVLIQAHKMGFRTVLSLHDYFTCCPNGGLYDFQDNVICPKVGLSLGCIKKHCDRQGRVQKSFRVLRSAVLRYSGVLKRIDGVIYLSAFSRSKFGELYANAKSAFIPNPSGSSAAMKANPVCSNYILFVGQLSPEKGPLLVAQAAYEAGIHIVFAGSGIQSEEIKRANPNATLLGWVSQEKVLDMIAGARAVVFPSRWYEVQPLVPLQAMRMGIPVIVSASCAASEYVEDGVTGFVVPDSHGEAWRQRLELLRNDELVQKLGTGAYEWFSHRWPTDQTHLNSLLDFYHSL